MRPLHLLLLAGALLGASCSAPPPASDAGSERVAELLDAYHRISLGMSKPEIIGIAGPPDRTFTPKSHRLNMRFDRWSYDAPGGAGQVTTVLELQFPYLESASPGARLVAKSYSTLRHSLSERDQTLFKATTAPGR